MRVSELLGKGPRASIAVVGEIRLDLSFPLSADSDHGPASCLPAHRALSCAQALGGAAGVAVLCKRLTGGRVDLYGAVGRDVFGDGMLSLLNREGVGTQGVSRLPEGGQTRVRQRFTRAGSECFRCDAGAFGSIDDPQADSLLAGLASGLSGYGCVVVSLQAAAGAPGGRFVRRLNELVRRPDGPVWIVQGAAFADACPPSVRVLTAAEARQLSAARAEETGTEEADADICAALSRRWKTTVVLDRWPDGALAFDGRQAFTERGLHIVRDENAGEAPGAFVAGLSLALHFDVPLPEALSLANLAAAAAVRGPGGALAGDVLSLAENPDYRCRPELAKDARLAVYHSGTEIEVISRDCLGDRQRKSPRCAVFDLDGTLSTLREGWDAMMERMMVEAVAGKAFRTLSAEALERIREKARQVIERTAGIQTLTQMEELASLVARFGHVDPQAIKTARQYKEEYAAEIRAMAKKRTDLYRSGLLSQEDVTVKGAVPFLKRLRGMGVTLFLASGADQEDMQAEVDTFGYGLLFNGGIFGSTGDAGRDPKRLVMRAASETAARSCPDGPLPGDCVVFGDGPVELREGKRMGFLAVGLLSDERRRFGLNLDKRERLVLAGADLLIPDYSWAPALAALLGWE